MFWNVQGAASPAFHRSFLFMVKNYHLNMVIIFEPQISGVRADNLIKRSGFNYSHRVEAHGFSWGIWILWKDMFTMEVIFNHKQFSHFKVAKNNSLLSWITAVYESPIPCLQKQLWDNLESLAGMVRGPWLVGGGTFILSFMRRRKKRGSLRSTGVCGSFSRWFHSNKLHDLSFNGPRFTWSRGNLLKRLDRVVCNMTGFINLSTV